MHDSTVEHNDLGMHNRVVAGVFDQVEDTNRMVEWLQSNGWPTESIGLVAQGPGERFVHRDAADTKAGATATAGAAVGATAGGLAGILAGVGLLAIPGIGPILAAGFAGAAIGGAMGGLAGSFAGLGIPDESAREYEAAVQQGGLFVSVKVDDQETADRVCGTMTHMGARSVNSYTAKL